MPLIAGLAAAFFVAALLYASVGFGGGSTYAALLALSGADYRVLPVIALACNILVVAGSSVRFARAGLTPWRGAALLTALAAPAAFIGGTIPIGREAFLMLLGGSLVLAGVAMILPSRTEHSHNHLTAAARFVPLMAPPLGLLAGIVGIGGGIFLAPLLHLTRWRNARAIAATASLFILVNSLFGLAGQLAKRGVDLFARAMVEALPLLIAVAVGGQIGGLLAVRLLPLRWIRWLTAVLVVIVGVRLLLGM